MTRKKELLEDLLNEIYHTEDVIDGTYSPDDKEVTEFDEINTRYRQLLKDMNKLVELIDYELNKIKNK